MLLFIKINPTRIWPILWDIEPIILMPIRENILIFLAKAIVIILRMAPARLKKNGIVNRPVLIRPIMNTLISETLKASLKL